MIKRFVVLARKRGQKTTQVWSNYDTMAEAIENGHRLFREGFHEVAAFDVWKSHQFLILIKENGK